MTAAPTAGDRAARIERLAYDYGAQPAEPVAACNLCGSTHHVEAARRDRYGFPATLSVCAGCGLGFLSPRMTAEAYAGFYRDVYRPLVSAYHGRLIDAETVQIEQRDYARELTAFLARSLPRRPRSVFDVGGSTGVVAGAVREAFGAAATVLDPAPDELAVAARAGMETVAGFMEDFDPGERRWDLVLLCQTIDHLLDVRATLDAIRGVLAADGHAFVDVLDVGHVMLREGGIEGAVKIDHPYYLTRATATGYFARCGLRVVAERMADDGHWGFLLAPGRP
ncbi:MAG TPA: methyltransferase domain-containing protein, partial [Solirubrobacteraceae bacterium]|nr:methyltransferase domain-containing protein [Solirubrobacteraceae bacterium]